VRFTIRAPLDDLFAADDRHPDASVTGIVIVNGQTINGVEISTRGHTSADSNECSFPKLKLRFAKPPASPPFAGLRTLKIGTHCGDLPDGQLTQKYGRLANPKSPYREAWVYRLLGVMGVPTLKARPAEITYASATGNPPLVRPAMLLEDDGDARKRLGAEGEIEPAQFDTAQSTFSTAALADVMFAEAMIGNFDWCLKLTPTDTYRCDAQKRLWNILALRRGERRAIPLIYDFDLAGMVTGSHPWFAKVYDKAFAPSRSAIEVEVLSQVQRTRSVLSRAELDAARRRFVERKGAAFQALDHSGLDSEGARIAREYLTSFFNAIESDDHFYRPVVATEGVEVFADDASSQPACGNQSTVPLGTPVSEPLMRSAEKVQVLLLDVHWHWTGKSACEALRNGVWIDAGALARNYPSR
jgi:hypothetical protein